MRLPLLVPLRAASSPGGSPPSREGDEERREPALPAQGKPPAARRGGAGWLAQLLGCLGLLAALVREPEGDQRGGAALRTLLVG